MKKSTPYNLNIMKQIPIMLKNMICIKNKYSAVPETFECKMNDLSENQVFSWELNNS